MALSMHPLGHDGPSLAAVHTLAEMVPLLRGLAEAAKSVETLRASRLGPEITQALQPLRMMGLSHEPAILNAWAQGAYFTAPSLGQWGSVSPRLVRMAAFSSLAAIAAEGPGEASLAALDALVGGGLVEAAEGLAFDALDLGELPGTLSSLMTTASERLAGLPELQARLEYATRNGGLPQRTELSTDQAAALEAELHALPVEFVHEVRVPTVIDWRPSKTMPGVAHGRALPLPHDPQDGSVIIPIAMASGARYFEHLHLGREHVVFFPGSGPILDRQGRYVRDADYAMEPGSLHTPFVPFGEWPALFLGVAEYGVVMSPFTTATTGAELMEAAQANPAQVAALFRSLEPHDVVRRSNPRDEVAQALFRELEHTVATWRAAQQATDETHDMVHEPRFFFDWIGSFFRDDLLTWARRRNG